MPLLPLRKLLACSRYHLLPVTTAVFGCFSLFMTLDNERVHRCEHLCFGWGGRIGEGVVRDSRTFHPGPKTADCAGARGLPLYSIGNHCGPDVLEVEFLAARPAEANQPRAPAP